MRQLLYVMQFRGRVIGNDNTYRSLRTTAFAPSCTTTTVIGAAGLSCAIEPVAGERATFESQMSTDEANRLRGVATVTFGAASHRLYLSVFGHSDLDGTASSPSHRSIAWKVERGEGQFAGASGLITSNLVVGSAGELTDSQLGVIFLGSPREWDDRISG